MKTTTFYEPYNQSAFVASRVLLAMVLILLAALVTMIGWLGHLVCYEAGNNICQGFNQL